MEPATEAVDVLKEAGLLEADTGAKFDEVLAGISPDVKIEMDPRAHQPLRPEQMFIRHELRQAKQQTLAVRRVALKKLLLQAFIQEDQELRAHGLAYARPGP